MSEIKNSKNIVIILAVLFVATLIYSIYAKVENTKFVNQLTTEKNEIQSNLDKMIKQYDTEIKKNTALNDDLKNEKATVVALRDSIAHTKKVDYAIIRHLRSKLFKLEQTNKHLTYMVDSISHANKALSQSLDSTEVVVEMKNDSIKNLVGENVMLTKNVKDGSALQLYALSATGVKLKSSGRLVLTTRAHRINNIRVCTVVTKNLLAPKGNRDLYVQITNPEGKIVGKNQSFDMDGKTINYSEKTTFFYQNIDAKICVLTAIEAKADHPKGTYKVKVFGEDRLLGELDLNLR